MELTAVPARHADLTEKIIGAAMHVHSQLGPGLLESVYETCLAYELEVRGMKVERQVMVPIKYGDMRLEGGLRLDMLVDDVVVVEVKSVESLAPIHGAQLLTYLKLSSHHVGLLLNFNVEHMRAGIRRIIHGT